MDLSTVASIEAETAAASLRSVGYGKRTDLAAIDADIATVRGRMTAIASRRQDLAARRQAAMDGIVPLAEAAQSTAAKAARAKAAGFDVGGQAVARAKAASDNLMTAATGALESVKALAAEDAALFAEADALYNLVVNLDDEAAEARKPFNRRWGGRS